MRVAFLLAAPACLLLAACGGGGGGVNSTPSPAPAPAPTPAPTPTPTNTTLNDLVASQDFANHAESSQMAFDLTDGTVIASAGDTNDIKFSYDASTKSYSLTIGGKTDAFKPSDLSTTSNNDRRFILTKLGGNTYLTLVDVPYTTARVTDYVRMGYFQRDAIGGGRQDTLFSSFVYGFPTASSAVPLTGTAGYGIDLFGAETTPGGVPRMFRGAGEFIVDLSNGTFSAYSTLLESDLLTGEGLAGGAIDWFAGGDLSSGSSSFSGATLYRGFYGSIGGTIQGSFYGPTAQEVGASFSGSGTNGTFTGSFTGRKDSSVAINNLTMASLTTPPDFRTHEVWLVINRNVNDPNYIGGASEQLQYKIQYRGADDFSYVPSSSLAWPILKFTAADKIASPDADFTAYRKTVDGHDVTVMLAKPGEANSKIALTYASFGSVSWPETAAGRTNDISQFFTYGLETPLGLLSGRTGSAQYKGVVYGAGANGRTSASYDLTGTSQFDVDFTNQSLTGTLAIMGNGTNGTPSLDFGTFTFDGLLSTFGTNVAIDVRQGTGAGGNIFPLFYGPGGEEIAAPFSITYFDGSPNAGAYLAGVALAKVGN